MPAARSFLVDMSIFDKCAGERVIAASKNVYGNFFHEVKLFKRTGTI
jgi:hypothetical protein